MLLSENQGLFYNVILVNFANFDSLGFFFFWKISSITKGRKKMSAVLPQMRPSLGKSTSHVRVSIRVLVTPLSYSAPTNTFGRSRETAQHLGPWFSHGRPTLVSWPLTSAMPVPMLQLAGERTVRWTLLALSLSVSPILVLCHSTFQMHNDTHTHTHYMLFF